MKKSEKALYNHAIKWFLEYENLKGQISVKEWHKPFFHGRCNHIKNDKVVIQLNPVKNMYFNLQVLFHELTHAKQYLTGALSSTADAFFWHGDDMTDVGYEEQPWEIEARAVEKVLADLYLKECW